MDNSVVTAGRRGMKWIFWMKYLSLCKLDYMENITVMSVWPWIWIPIWLFTPYLFDIKQHIPLKPILLHHLFPLYFHKSNICEALWFILFTSWNYYNFLSSVITKKSHLYIQDAPCKIFYIYTMSFIFSDTDLASSFTVSSTFQWIYYILPRGNSMLSSCKAFLFFTCF